MAVLGHRPEAANERSGCASLGFDERGGGNDGTGDNHADSGLAPEDDRSTLQ
jgi:hypothetical protein